MWIDITTPEEHGRLGQSDIIVLGQLCRIITHCERMPMNSLVAVRNMCSVCSFLFILDKGHALPSCSFDSLNLVIKTVAVGKSLQNTNDV